MFGLRPFRLRRRNRASHLRFLVYTRPECSCCHRAIELLRHRQQAYGFALDLVEIDTDPDLATRYALEIPIVIVDQKVRFKGIVNPALLDRLLAAESR